MNIFKMSLNALKNIYYEQVSYLNSSEKVELVKTITKNIDNDGEHIYIPKSMTELEIVRVGTILYVFQPKKEYAEIHLSTGDVIEYRIGTDELWAHLEDNYYMYVEGFEEPQFMFRDLGYCQLVNMSNVQSYHSNLYRAYFSDDHYISVVGTSCRYRKDNKGGDLVRYLGKKKDRFLSAPESEIYVYSPRETKKKAYN